MHLSRDFVLGVRATIDLKTDAVPWVGILLFDEIRRVNWLFTRGTTWGLAALRRNAVGHAILCRSFHTVRRFHHRIENTQNFRLEFDLLQCDRLRVSWKRLGSRY